MYTIQKVWIDKSKSKVFPAFDMRFQKHFVFTLLLRHWDEFEILPITELKTWSFHRDERTLRLFPFKNFDFLCNETHFEDFNWEQIDTSNWQTRAEICQ